MSELFNFDFSIPCEEITPVNPFPFKSDRISRGLRFEHYLIFILFYPEYKKTQHLKTFNLQTFCWSSTTLQDAPELFETTNDFVMTQSGDDKFLFFGCYKIFKANNTGNLFSQVQLAKVRKVLGFIKVRLEQDELFLEWEEFAKADELPYRIDCSINIYKDHVYIFGGKDENDKMSNQLVRFNMTNSQISDIQLKETNSEGVPGPRANHYGLMSNEGLLYIFGGEIDELGTMDFSWSLDISREEGIAGCLKINQGRTTSHYRPKAGAGFLWLKESLLFVTGRESPEKNYLCYESFHDHDRGWNLCSQKPLPFSRTPSIITKFEDQLILCAGSSIYAIPFTRGKILKPTALPKPDLFDSHGASLVQKNIKRSFKEQVRQHFEERPFPDVVFRVQGQNISAHRSFIAVRSPFFLQLFSAHDQASGKDEETKTDETIEISDLSPAAFTVLLEWLYCNEVLNLKDEVAAEFFKVSDKYGVPKLKSEAEKCLVKNITIENVLERAKLASEENSKELENAVVIFVAKEIEEVNKRYDLRDFPKSILFRMCKSGQ